MTIDCIAHEALEQGSAEWLAHRQEYCNASEAAAALDRGAFNPRNKVALTKLRAGETKSFRSSQMLHGHKREPAIREMVETYISEVLGVWLTLNPMVFTRIVDDLPLSASLDGFFITPEGTRVGVEIKAVTTPNSPYWTDDKSVCPSILAQVDHQILTAQLDMCFIAIELEGDIRLDCVLPDDNRMKELLCEWGKVYPYLRDGKIYPDDTLTDDPAFLEAAEQYRKVSEDLALMKELQDTLKDRLIELAEGRTVTGGGLKVFEVPGSSQPDYSKLPDDIKAGLPRKERKGYWRVAVAGD